MQGPEDVERICSPETLSYNEKLMQKGTKRAIMVEATALSKILASLEHKANFTLLAKTCDSVICCRVSPKQKADVVALIK
jgi:phospholipid-transporting ATPase